MDRKIKNTRRECADTLPNLFQALKIHTQTHTDMNTDTVRMLCFLAFATSESDIFTLAVFCFEYLSLPFRRQTASSLFCGCLKKSPLNLGYRRPLWQNTVSTPLTATLTHQVRLCIFECTFWILQDNQSSFQYSKEFCNYSRNAIQQIPLVRLANFNYILPCNAETDSTS